MTKHLCTNSSLKIFIILNISPCSVKRTNILRQVTRVFRQKTTNISHLSSKISSKNEEILAMYPGVSKQIDRRYHTKEALVRDERRDRWRIPTGYSRTLDSYHIIMHDVGERDTRRANATYCIRRCDPRRGNKSDAVELQNSGGTCRLISDVDI